MKRIAILLVAVLALPASSGDFVTGNATLPPNTRGTKVDARPLPAGADASRFITAPDINEHTNRIDALVGAAYDLRLYTHQVNDRVGGAESTHAADKTAQATRDAGQDSARIEVIADLRAEIASAAMGGGVNIADTSTVLATGAATPRTLADHLGSPRARVFTATASDGEVAFIANEGSKVCLNSTCSAYLRFTRGAFEASVPIGAPSDDALTVPFAPPGCYASGSPLGSKGEILSATRADAGRIVVSGGEQACAANQARVGVQGLLAEPAVTQHLTSNCSSPATQTVTLPIGTFTAWLEGGGSMALAAGTASTSGLPCAASGSAMSCTFTVTAGGTVTATISGTVPRAFLHSGAYRMSPVCGAARAIDHIVTATAPLDSSELSWCIGGAFAPVYGRAWDASGAVNSYLVGTENASIYTYSGSIRLDTWDGVATKQIACSPGTGVPAFAVGSRHEIWGCGDNGTLSIWVDGTKCNTATSFTGSGRPAILSAMHFGTNSSGASAFGGFTANVRAVRRPSPPVTAAQSRRILWLGDSIHNTSILHTAISGHLTGPVTHDAGTFGGTVVGTGLLELADETQAYLAGAWAPRTRGVAFSAYSGLVFNYGRNDCNAGANLDAFRKAYDKIAAQAFAKEFPSVVSANMPPKALADLSGWDSADLCETGGHRAATNTVAEKYGTAHLDTFATMKSWATRGWSVAQLMRDTLHPTYTPALDTLLPAWIAPRLLDDVSSTATPEISGRVVNYLFGQPTAGSWTQTALAVGTTPSLGPTNRIAGLPDQANIASAAGATVTFPSVTFTQAWAHFFVDQTSGGTVNLKVDGVTVATFNTFQGGVTRYPRSVLIADGLSASPHTVEIETTSGDPVRVLGVTYVGVP
jgi:hypothetical protein